MTFSPLEMIILQKKKKPCIIKLKALSVYQMVVGNY